MPQRFMQVFFKGISLGGEIPDLWGISSQLSPCKREMRLMFFLSEANEHLDFCTPPREQLSHFMLNIATDRCLVHSGIQDYGKGARKMGRSHDQNNHDLLKSRANSRAKWPTPGYISCSTNSIHLYNQMFHKQGTLFIGC